MSMAEAMLCSFQEGQKRPDSFHLVLLEPLFLECSLLYPISHTMRSPRHTERPHIGALVKSPTEPSLERASPGASHVSEEAMLGGNPPGSAIQHFQFEATDITEWIQASSTVPFPDS